MEGAGRVGPHIAQNAAPAPDQEEVPDPPNSKAQNLSMVLWDVFPELGLREGDLPKGTFMEQQHRTAGP